MSAYASLSIYAGLRLAGLLARLPFVLGRRMVLGARLGAAACLPPAPFRESQLRARVFGDGQRKTPPNSSSKRLLYHR